MRVQNNKKRYKASISISALMLAGCGGGGGGGGQSPTVTPRNSTPITVIPPTAPVPIDVAFLDTQEFRRSSALEQINVFPAYEEGLSGRGVTVAIIDTGIDTDNPEFAGRISANSRDLVIAGIVASDELREGGPSLDDEQGHGTAVAGIIGAARNDIDIHGVAPEVELLILRASQNDTLTILGAALTQGSIDAVNNNVDVLNFSFGSNEDIARPAFRNIFGRLADADIVTVVAVGNDNLAHPDESSRAASDPQAQGAVIIVGSVNRDNELSSFSNQAGDAADFFIVAPGLGIPTVAIDGGTRSFSGTSASAPFVTGAAALLRERWPNLTAPEVVDILLTSATDLGAPGADEIFGRGLLNVGAALQPIGTTSAITSTGGKITISSVTQTSLSAPFGTDANRFSGFGPVIVFDDFNRDFAVDINSISQIQNTSALDIENHVSPILQSRFSNVQLSRGLQITSQVTQSVAPEDPRVGFVGFRNDGVTPNDVSQNTRTSFAVMQHLPNATKVTLASGFSSSLTDDIAGVSLKPNAQFLGRNIFDDAYTARFESDVSSLVNLPSGKGRSFDARWLRYSAYLSL